MLANRIRMSGSSKEDFETEWISANDGNLVDLEFDGKKIMDPQIRFEGVNYVKEKYIQNVPVNNLVVTDGEDLNGGYFPDEPAESIGITKYQYALNLHSPSGATYPHTVTTLFTMVTGGTPIEKTRQATVDNEYDLGDSSGIITGSEDINAIKNDRYVLTNTSSNDSDKFEYSIVLNTYYNYYTYTVDPRILIGSTPTGYSGTLSGGSQTAWYNIADFVNGSTQLSGEIDVGGSDKLKYQIRGTLK